MNRYLNVLLERTQEFCSQCKEISYSEDVYVYHPLDYAWRLHEAYLRRFVAHRSQLFMLGMNPGPFGMAQTGIPFGEVSVVKEYLKIDEPLGSLPPMHPKRPISGLSCPRSEVSGRRLWALIKQRYPDSSSLYEEVAIMNYCPVVFVDKGATGKNITPDKIEITSRKSLEKVCDSYLDDMISLIEPEFVVGIGKYAQKKLEQSVDRLDKAITVHSILHPSPANPQANKNWNEKVIKTLNECNIWKG